MISNTLLGTSKYPKLSASNLPNRIRRFTLSLGPRYYIDAAFDPRPRDGNHISSITPLWPIGATNAIVSNTRLFRGYLIEGGLEVSSVQNLTISPTLAHTTILCYSPQQNQSQWGDCGLYSSTNFQFQSGILIFSDLNVGIGSFVSKSGAQVQTVLYDKRPSLVYKGSTYTIVQRCVSERADTWINQDRLETIQYNTVVMSSLPNTNPKVTFSPNFNGTLYYYAVFDYALTDLQIQTISRYLRLLYGNG